MLSGNAMGLIPPTFPGNSAGGGKAQMTHKEYNGWTNYETWLVKLWIDNDEGSSSYWMEVAEDHLEDASDLADRLKEFHEETIYETCLKPSGMEASFIADLLNSAMSEVNWLEIANSMIEDAKERVS